MKKLHYKTVIKRLRDLILSENFNKAEIISCGTYTYTVSFPGNVRVQIDLDNCFNTFYSQRPGQLHYMELDSGEHGHTSDNMRITPQFAYLIWRMFNSRRDLKQLDGFYWRSLESWGRRINAGFELNPLQSNADVLARLK